MAVHLGNDWDELLAGEFSKEYYLALRQFLIQEYRYRTIYPDMYKIFEALKRTSYAQTKVVLLGQDPYHGPGQAHGLAFSCPRCPNSIAADIFREWSGIWPPSRPTAVWSLGDQGAAFEHNADRAAGRPGPSGQGLERLRTGSWSCSTTKDTVVFLLWGGRPRSSGVHQAPPLVLTAPIQSPLASRGFFGCGHFSKANASKRKRGQGPLTGAIA